MKQKHNNNNDNNITTPPPTTTTITTMYYFTTNINDDNDIDNNINKTMIMIRLPIQCFYRFVVHVAICYSLQHLYVCLNS